MSFCGIVDVAVWLHAVKDAHAAKMATIGVKECFLKFM